MSLSTITGIGVVASLFMLNTIAIIYTMLGGMKARVIPLDLPSRLRKAGRVWCGGARETH